MTNDALLELSQITSFSDFVRFAQTPDRVLIKQELIRLIVFLQCFYHRCSDKSRAYGVDPNSTRRVFQRRGLGQTHDSMLGRHIAYRMRETHLPENGGQITIEPPPVFNIAVIWDFVQ